MHSVTFYHQKSYFSNFFPLYWLNQVTKILAMPTRILYKTQPRPFFLPPCIFRPELRKSFTICLVVYLQIWHFSINKKIFEHFWVSVFGPGPGLKTENQPVSDWFWPLVRYRTGSFAFFGLLCRSQSEHRDRMRLKHFSVPIYGLKFKKYRVTSIEKL